MNIKLEDGIGYAYVKMVIGKNFGNCKIGNKNIPVNANKDGRKLIVAKFIVRESWKISHEEGDYSTPIQGGAMYRVAQKVTGRTKIGKLFGEDIYSPDTGTELLCISKYIITDTDDKVPLDKKGKERPIEIKKTWKDA